MTGERTYRPSVLIMLLFAVSVLLTPTAAPAWTHYGGDAASTKFADLRQIDSTNVDSLRIIWRWKTADRQVGPEIEGDVLYRSTPIVVDNVLYTISPYGLVSALDAATGQERWTFDSRAWERPDAKFFGFHRGVSHWRGGDEERILFGTSDASLWSIDARTGQPDSSFGVNGRLDLTEGLGRPVDGDYYAAVSPPQIFDDIVIVGSSGFDWRLGRERPEKVAPGDVRGFDIRTGQQRWIFHSPPHDGEFGADTWTPGAYQQRGGANVWSMATVDHELGYVYLPFGTPDGDFYGGERPGDNLFAESLVCLNARTGQRVWHYQLIHHGLWDYDIPAAPILVDVVVDGQPRKAVAQVTKQAFCFVFDRVTGEPLWPIEERPVPASNVPGEQAAPTQPFPTRPAPFDVQGVTEEDLIDFTPQLRAEALQMLDGWILGPLFTPPSVRQPTLMVPGTLGGADWAGASVDPRSGVLFVPSKTWPSQLYLREPRGSSAEGAYRYLGHARRRTSPSGLPLLKPPFGRITAIDLNTGEHLWMVANAQGPVHHPAIRHLDLPDLGWYSRVFVITTPTLLLSTQDQPRGGGDYWREPEHFLNAWDKASGRLLARVPLPDYSRGALMSYEAQGRQYVVTPVGRRHDAELVALAIPRAEERLGPQLVERFDAEHRQFYRAMAQIDSGNVEELRDLLRAEPGLLTARGYLDTVSYGWNYYQGSQLLHGLANNPTRQRSIPRILETLDLLLELGADVAAANGDGNTPLSLAMTSRQIARQGVKVEIVKRLIAAGAPVDERSAMPAFSRYREPEMIDVLADSGLPRDLRTAAAFGEIDTLRRMIDGDGQLRPRARAWPLIADSLRTDQHVLDMALSFAAYWNRIEAMEWLVAHGAQVNGRPTGFYFPQETGSTALHKAADAGRMEAVRWLLANGANPTLPDLRWDDLPARWASYQGHQEVGQAIEQAAGQWLSERGSDAD